MFFLFYDDPKNNHYFNALPILFVVNDSWYYELCGLFDDGDLFDGKTDNFLLVSDKVRPWEGIFPILFEKPK